MIRRVVVWWSARSVGRRLGISVLASAAVGVLALLAWQALSAQGNPDPLAPTLDRNAALLSIGVLVFREGLESILVLTALTASLTGRLQRHRRPVTLGALIGLGATGITWALAVRIVAALSEELSALTLQAATGLLAVLVLLLVMNWFFHKVYWTGWIAHKTSHRQTLLRGAATGHVSRRQLLWGLGLLGFASVYREGFEVVLFLQSYYLRLGGSVVAGGALVGLGATATVGALTFWAHRHLPYRKLLVLTGVLLGAVLLVMVGEQAQEMQLARWIPTTPVPALTSLLPAWMGLWFSVFPSVETLTAQIIAAVLVLGSYFAARPRGRNLADHA